MNYNFIIFGQSMLGSAVMSQSVSRNVHIDKTDAELYTACPVCHWSLDVLYKGQIAEWPVTRRRLFCWRQNFLQMTSFNDAGHGNKIMQLYKRCRFAVCSATVLFFNRRFCINWLVNLFRQEPQQPDKNGRHDNGNPLQWLYCSPTKCTIPKNLPCQSQFRMSCDDWMTQNKLIRRLVDMAWERTVY